MRTYRWLVLLSVVLGAVLPATVGARDRAVRSGRVDTRVQGLQGFRTYRQIARVLQRSEFRNAYGALDRAVASVLGQPDVAMSAVLPAAAELADAVSASATGTNAQVAGVDEGDLVKTDGEYLYLLSGTRLAVVRGATLAADGDVGALELVSLVDLGEDGFLPSEVHLYGRFVVVVGMAYDYRFLTEPVTTAVGVTARRAASRLLPVVPCTARTMVRIYDVSDPSAPQAARTVTVEGSHLASRRVDRYLYLVARAYPGIAPAVTSLRSASGTGLVPRIGDSLRKGGMRNLRPTEVSLLPDCYEASYLVVAALDLSSAGGDFGVHAFLGAGNVVYASPESLYVAASSWFWRPVRIASAVDDAEPETPAETVVLYRFAWKGTGVEGVARGSAPGRVLNSFSMDEHDGVFRLATTTYPTVWTDAAQTSGVYTFDLDLNPLGRVEGLAPGERIYAARFLGSRCYLVTFETIDPLFVIGLDDPTRPEVLGELKIPGYSAYLQPLDATHLIGFGKDVARIQTPWSGEDGVPLEQGLKITLFDTSDAANPVELCSELIGVRGSDSEVLRDHHAFLYDSTRGLLAFPCTVREFVDPTDPADPWWWGDFVFQGVLGYRLTAARGFERLGGITHMAEGTELWEAPWHRTVRRALLLDDVLHTVSEGMVKANDASSLAELSVLELPAAEPPVDDPVVYWLTADAAPSSGSVVTDTTGYPGDPAGEQAGAPAASLGGLLRAYLENAR